MDKALSGQQKQNFTFFKHVINRQSCDELESVLHFSPVFMHFIRSVCNSGTQVLRNASLSPTRRRDGGQLVSSTEAFVSSRRGGPEVCVMPGRGFLLLLLLLFVTLYKGMSQKVSSDGC